MFDDEKRISKSVIMKQGTSSMAWNRPTKAISSLELNKNLDPETYSSYSTSDNLSTKSASSGVWNSTKEALKGNQC